MGLFQKTYDFDTVTTKGGDTGQSSLFSGEREYKNNIRFELIGEMDELQSLIGLVRSKFPNYKLSLLREIQERLYDYMAVIATDKNSEFYDMIKKPQEQHIERIEKAQSKMLNSTEIPQKFIIPGDSTEIVAWFDYVRAVVRRSERTSVKLIQFFSSSTNESKKIDFDDVKMIQKYINRLSDYFFILSRYLEQTA